ncbi:MAG TPA: GNAT family N-acetyltransferase [Polyangia bacterium]|nr:GNAT family N-acetyltransferase [Polyangia bacterium]
MTRDRDVVTLKRSSPEALAEAADINFVTHAGWLQARLQGMRVFDQGDLMLLDSGLPCDTFNFVCRARLSAGAAEERAAETIGHFRRAGRPFSWWVGPADRPRDLGDILLGAGLLRAETERAMAADLEGLQPGDFAPPGWHVRRVSSESELRTFAELNATHWTPPDPHVLRFYELGAAALLTHHCPLWFYVGYLDDVPVATGELTTGDGVVGLYNIATLAAHRRRGYGTALTQHLLLEARARGYRTAILQAAPAGVSLYERLGFRSFGDITEYKPPAAASPPR